MSDFETPHPKNVPGPFYVLDGCCTRCGVPEAHAPLHFGFDDQDHCFICRQPADGGEADQVIDAAVCAELECIRYRGADMQVLLRLAEAGREHLADVPLPLEVVRLAVTDRVRFRLTRGGEPSALEAAVAFREFLEDSYRRYEAETGSPLYKMGQAEGGRKEASLAYGRPEEKIDVVEFQLFDTASGAYLTRHFAADRPRGRRIAHELRDWCFTAAVSDSVRWFTAASWEEGGPGLLLPWSR